MNSRFGLHRKFVVLSIFLTVSLTAVTDWNAKAEAASLKLAWIDNSTNEDGFRIERFNGTAFVKIATLGANITSYIDSGLLAGTNYCYVVRSFNSSGLSDPSNAACGIASDLSTGTVTVGDPSLKLTWTDNSTNEDGFKIERLNGTAFVEIATVGPNIQFYFDAGLAAGTTYCYRVRAFNSSGSSEPTNQACATAKASGTGTVQIPPSSTPLLPPSEPLPPPPEPLPPPPPPIKPVQNSLVAWTDYRVELDMKSTENGTIGVIFRYQDRNNYYRFSWSNSVNLPPGRARRYTYRRLERMENGALTVLAADTVRYSTGKTYRLAINAQGTTLSVEIDGSRIFSVKDASFATGTIALYSNYKRGSIFDNILVTDPTTGAILMSDDFNDGDLKGWTVLDENSANSGPFAWSAETGALVTTGLGTYALYTKRSWFDYLVRLKIQTVDNGCIGVMFRYQDNYNYYRFSWCNDGNFRRRLDKIERGTLTTLIEDAVPFTIGQTYLVEVEARGMTLEVRIDRSTIFSITDTTFSEGTIALYSWRNPGSIFDEIEVTDLNTNAQLLWDDFNDGNVNGWTIVDDYGTSSGSSVWSAQNGALVQSSNFGSNSTGGFGTFTLY